MDRVRVIDSHTEGEPTRVVIDGAPALHGRTLAEKVNELRELHDSFRTGVVCEPRGYDALVGALLCEPDQDADFGVIFFNNVGYLGMCGHGTIGLVETLRYMGRVKPGGVEIDTPVGTVRAVLHQDGRVSVYNVRSYRYRKDVAVNVPGIGEVVGDIAYGGNWFFLVTSPSPPLDKSRIRQLLEYSSKIRHALDEQGIGGEAGGIIDHIELYGPPTDPTKHSQNFVLCPGLEYDRSPCGTGTSAKLACLAADGKLQPGEVFRQESILGTVFEGTYAPGESGGVMPCITGRAFVTAETTLIFDPQDSLQGAS